MAGKPFNPDLYDTDDNAKDQWIAFLKSMSWTAWVNPDQYGIDVLSVDPDGNERQYEVEVKHNWRGPKFKYETLHYSDRKRKFLNNPEKTFFVTMNHNRTHALVVGGLELLHSPTIIKDTIYTNNEKFIEVSINDCSLLQIRSIDGYDS